MKDERRAKIRVEVESREARVFKIHCSSSGLERLESTKVGPDEGTFKRLFFSLVLDSQALT